MSIHFNTKRRSSMSSFFLMFSKCILKWQMIVVTEMCYFLGVIYIQHVGIFNVFEYGLPLSKENNRSFIREAGVKIEECCLCKCIKRNRTTKTPSWNSVVNFDCYHFVFQNGNISWTMHFQFHDFRQIHFKPWIKCILTLPWNIKERGIEVLF